ncbi:endonuclease/exonuclease/phosphatase family protein [Bacteroides sp. 519]|uniref:endonuclease/exonuclease/phosphatase family protein n=1 Tax=Bacteroides sp. 519 TaxID=2302937 RepID=UPI0013D7E2FA|nr:endonuclease/exonuclease/phosphatase family protein [Bacteroides sp. 519]NDV59068.1 endonuclease [Bacteroides sp. 519]
MKRTFFVFLSFLCFVSVIAQTVQPKEENSLRIMSYNIRNCIGIDGKMDIQRVADVINEVAPDFVAIQEVDSAATRTNGVYVLEEVAKKALMHPSFAPAIDFQGGKYGVGLLSKEVPLNIRQIPLPGKEARVLLVAEFDKCVVCCTHFALTKEERMESVSIILDALKDITKPVFLAGDMNSLYDSEEQKLLREHFVVLNNPKQNTFPSDTPRECIDYMYGFKNAGNTYSVLGRNVLNNRLGSDHLPLYVDVRLKAEQADIFRTKPYLQNPTDNGITVSWFTNVPVHAWVEYGTDGKLDQRKELYVDGQMICNNKHHKIRLTGLEPGKTYYYRVCSREITLYQAYKKEFGETAYSDTYRFIMPSESTQDFTAIILNDIHKNNKLMAMVEQVILGMDYDMVFFNGDCIDDPKNEQDAVGFLSYMNEKVKAQNVPVFYMRGNHEIRNAYSIELRNLIDYVGDKTYGAFSWGDTRFVMLDCGEDKPDSTWVYYGLNDFEGLRLNQAQFLKQELNSKVFKKANKRVLIHHIPIYGMRAESYNPCLKLWGDLLQKAPFNVSLNAHTHRYAYHEKGAVDNNFPVVIGGGNRPESATIMVLRKKGNDMTLTVLTPTGESKLELKL